MTYSTSKIMLSNEWRDILIATSDAPATFANPSTITHHAGDVIITYHTSRVIRSFAEEGQYTYWLALDRTEDKGGGCRTARRDG